MPPETKTSINFIPAFRVFYVIPVGSVSVTICRYDAYAIKKQSIILLGRDKVTTSDVFSLASLYIHIYMT